MLQEEEIRGKANVSVASVDQVRAVRKPVRGVLKFVCYDRGVLALDRASRHYKGVEIGKDHAVILWRNLVELFEESKGCCWREDIVS